MKNDRRSFFILWFNGLMVVWLNKSMEKKYLQLSDIHAYQNAYNLSNYICDIVSKWDWFSKRTLGSQYVEATDSIAGNIAEGFGRFHKKDKQKFYYNARGSVYESIHWTNIASDRKLLTENEKQHINEELRKLPKNINCQIKLTEEKLTK